MPTPSLTSGWLARPGLAWLWLAVAALLLAATLARFLPQPPIETDLLALLPPTERNPLAERAASRLGRLTGERAVFLVGLADTAAARQAAALLAEHLQRGQLFRRVVTRLPSPDPGALLDLYAPYRAGLAPPPDDYPGRLAARLSGPFGGGALPLAEDPFALLDDWLGQLPFRQFRLDLEDGWLTARRDGVTWILVSGELAGSAFDPAAQASLQAMLPDAEAELARRWSGVRVLRAGAIFHATQARSQAEGEMHVIGLGSLLGIVLLLWLAYRSLGPLLLGLLSVGIGLCAAVLATSLAFGRLHLMTLVFGASLIGEAIDYAIQYFSARLGAGPAWDARRGVAAVLPGLAVALATSLVGYAALSLTPFPALRQIALFAICGLVAAWLTVVLLLPAWLRRPARRPAAALLAWPGRWLNLWRRLKPGTLLAGVALLLALAAPGWWKLSSDDDVRQLIRPEAHLAEQENQLRRLTGLEAGSQFFLVEGADAEQVLRREEALAERLSQAGVESTSVARFVPSCERQRAHRARLLAGLSAQRAALDELGFRAEVNQVWSKTVLSPPDCLRPAVWLASPISIPYRHLWLADDPAHPAGIALPSGHADVKTLVSAATGLPGVTLVDKPGAVSRLFGEYRRLAGYVLAAATVLIFLVLAWRYGTRGGLAILLPSLLAQALTLGLLGQLGLALNLFHVLALLLVLGVGINYAIFLMEAMRGGGEREPAALLGVWLSAATTLLSFGLLGLSSMPALAGFGVTLAAGIGIAVLLAPAAAVLNPVKAA